MYKSTGKISKCSLFSKQCEYRCCDQDEPKRGEKINHENYIMLHPGEWESAILSKKHIEIVDDNFFGGKLGRCKKDCFDQSNCSSDNNFKSMDCKTYPFFPRIDKSGNVILVIDGSRCPLSKKDGLDEHYSMILFKWNKVISKEPQVRDWILSFDLKGYRPYIINEK